MDSDNQSPLPDETRPQSGPPAEPLALPPETARVEFKVQVPQGSRLDVQVEARDPQGRLLERRAFTFANPPDPAEGSAPDQTAGTREMGTGWTALKDRANRLLSTPVNWPQVLFWAAMAVYLLVRVVGLAQFPIYFFTDEAVQTVLAADLVRDGFHNYNHELLPTFFQNGGQYNLSVSVYWQVLPYLLFGKSVWVTRGASVLATLLAAFAVGKILKDIYRSPYAWVAVLILSLTPAWFLHSRTAFETVLATSLYAGFLYLYLLYRCVSPRYLYGAVALGALAFYTYSPAQLYMLVTAVLLVISDARYHWQQRGMILRGVGLAALLALPYVRFLVLHPNENTRHLQILSSYWVQNIPLTEKLGRYFGEYLSGLNPIYWYLPNNRDLVRHLMRDYGHLARWTFPLALIGLVSVARGIRNPANRAVLIALLAAPSGAAIAQIGITRALVMVIPAALLSALGLAWLMDWLHQHARLNLSRQAVALAVFFILANVNGLMLADALNRGPTWFSDYGLGGMQYGARQVSAAIVSHLQDNPDDRIILSPSWANGTNEITRFFFDDPLPFQLGSIDGYLNEKREIGPDMLFIMIPEELQKAAESGKFSQITLEKVLPYPNGLPGFYFTRLLYSSQFDQVLMAEKEGRKALRDEIVDWDGKSTRVRFSTLDMGQIQDGFDGNDQSILRTMEANPMQLDIQPPEPRTFSHLGVRVGGTATRVTIYLYEKDQPRPRIFSQQVLDNPEPRYVTFNFNSAITAERIWISINSVNDREPAHVHLWEVKIW